MIAGAGLPVEVACRVLGVSGAGYYAWRSRPPSARTVRHAWLTDVIREVHAAAYGSYGARRVLACVAGVAGDLGRGDASFEGEADPAVSEVVGVVVGSRLSRAAGLCS